MSQKIKPYQFVQDKQTEQRLYTTESPTKGGVGVKKKNNSDHLQVCVLGCDKATTVRRHHLTFESTIEH